jgi:hypothetical protein
VLSNAVWFLKVLKAMMIGCNHTVSLLFLRTILSWLQNYFVMLDSRSMDHERKHVRVVLKLDFEKAYDKVNWDFLRYHMAKGFNIPLTCNAEISQHV